MCVYIVEGSIKTWQLARRGHSWRRRNRGSCREEGSWCCLCNPNTCLLRDPSLFGTKDGKISRPRERSEILLITKER